MMMVVVCPVTQWVVECGPKGVGWEVRMPKKWVKEWGDLRDADDKVPYSI